MKKKIVFITGITLAVVLLAMGCSNPTGGLDGNLGTGPLTLKGRIYEEGFPSPPSYTLSYTPINKNGTLTASTGESAAITNGFFDLTVTPSSSLASFSTVAAGEFFSDWVNVTSSNGSALFEALELATSGGTIGDGDLYRRKGQISVKGSSYTETYQGVFYLYVNADATITGDSRTSSHNNFYKAFTLDLKQGWNAVCVSGVYTGNFSSPEQSGTITLSISNPADLYWVFDDDSYIGG
ncbi:MAG: hypothetical protein LBK40_03170 [Spirochaetaceae bacterium]|jgi:hypothetical protein|nr:hypothetical protein [Spirochaetaceae bacterium]